MGIYKQPVGDNEVLIEQLAPERLRAIQQVLSNQGVCGQIVKLWWIQRDRSYYVLVKGSEGDFPTGHEVTLGSIIDAEDSY